MNKIPEFTSDEHRKLWHVDTAIRWCLEREIVRIKRHDGLPRPWTTDPALLNYRFCNVNRCHDKETEILFEQFYRPHTGSKDLWFNAAVARWINWSPTILKVGWTDLSNGYDAEDMYDRLKLVSKELDGAKLFTGAYLIRGCTSAKEVEGTGVDYELCKEKIYFLAHVVFKSISEVGPPVQGESLESYHARLMTAKSNGAFMAGQQIADLKYYTMHGAPDWKTWAPIGPGPVRFLNRMAGRPLERQIPKAQHYSELAEFFSLFKSRLEETATWDDWSDEAKALVQFHVEDAHNLGSNVMCEVDKWIRIQEGGRMRSRYDGIGDTTNKVF